MFVKSILIIIISQIAFSKAEDKYNYENVLAISVINLETNRSMVFAGPGFFLDFRSVIVQSTARFQPILLNVNYGSPIYELELASRAGPQMLLMGDRWLSDGLNITELEEVEFNRIQSLISQRSFDNDSTTRTGIMAKEALDAFENILTSAPQRNIENLDSSITPVSSTAETLADDKKFSNDASSSPQYLKNAPKLQSTQSSSASPSIKTIGSQNETNTNTTKVIANNSSTTTKETHLISESSGMHKIGITLLMLGALSVLYLVIRYKK